MMTADVLTVLLLQMILYQSVGGYLEGEALVRCFALTCCATVYIKQ